jgi:hypothetical protein
VFFRRATVCRRGGGRPCRAPAGVLALIATVATSTVSSAQATPTDQLFVAASQMVVSGTGTETLSASWAPSAFGCTGSQVFFLRSVMVSTVVKQTANQYQTGNYSLTFQAPQSRQGASPTSSPIFFSSGAQPSALFMVSSVGAPIASLQFAKNFFAGDVSIFLWGYCATPTTLGAITWKN